MRHGDRQNMAASSARMQQDGSGVQNPPILDQNKVFNYEYFLHRYNTAPQDMESYSFLRYFTSMPLFRRLVERFDLPSEQQELAVFKRRIDEIARKNPPSDREFEMQLRQQTVVDCYPFH